MENARKFFEETLKTEEAKAILAETEKPETEEETVKSYAEIAEKLGVELTVEEINEYFDSKSASGELDDSELSQLTGGANVKENSACSNTYKNKENCWLSDGCDFAIKKYDDYMCNKNLRGSLTIVKKALEIKEDIEGAIGQATSGNN